MGGDLGGAVKGFKKAMGDEDAKALDQDAEKTAAEQEPAKEKDEAK